MTAVLDRRWVPTPAALAVGAVLLAPGPSFGQGVSADCELTDFRSWERVSTGPQPIDWIGRPNLLCTDGSRIQADSAVLYTESGRNHLLGNVFFRDGTRELRAREVDYYRAQGQLFAHGSVELRDRATGREVRGDSLNLLEAGVFRPMEQVTVRGRPAFATLPPDGPPSGEAPAGESYAVEARVLRFEGERYFWADGEVDVVKDSLHMTSDSLAYDRELGTLVFTGDARMTNETGDFRGRRIALTLREGEVTSVLVQGSARLTTEEMDLLAAEIRLELLDGLLQRLVAVSVDGSGVGEPETPHLVTEDFLLTGDSLDVSSPNEVLESVLAIGNAWGQAHVRGDSVPLLALRPSERLQGAPVTSRSLETDWIEGDQIEVSFSRASRPAVTPGAPVDSVSTGGAPMPEMEGETYVSRLLAVGNAKTLYRRPPESDGEDATVSGAPTPAQGDGAPSREGWPISYILASEIAVFFQEGGEVQRIEADTDVRGLQLDPLTPASAARGTSVPSTAAPADASP